MSKAQAVQTTLLGHPLPNRWRYRGSFGPSGHSYEDKKTGMTIIESSAEHDDGREWVHISMSFPDRLPTYEEMCLVKAVFVGEDAEALQVFPPKRKHVNIHNFCLHLWHCTDEDIMPADLGEEGSI